MSWKFCNSTIVKKTRKDHKCVCCHRIIPAGSKNINHWAGMYDGDFQNSYECHWCGKNRDYFLDDGEYGEFWDGLQYKFEDLFEQYQECDCIDENEMNGVIEAELKDDYLIFKCDDCGKIHHKEHMPLLEE